MTKHEDEFFQKNNELSHELSKYVIEHPEMDSLLSGEGVVVFLPEFDPDLREFNMRMAREIESEGDGFIITAFLTSKVNCLNRRVQVRPS